MKWTDYKQQAQERGALALEFFVAQSTPVQGPEAVKAALPDHLAYISQLEAQGILAFAGPMSDETGEEMQGMGMLVFRATSLEEARTIVDADPMHTSGARQFTLRRWLINEGSITLSIGLSSRSVALS